MNLLLVELVVLSEGELDDIFTLMTGVGVTEHKAVITVLDACGLLGYNHVDEVCCVWADRLGVFSLASFIFPGVDHHLINFKFNIRDFGVLKWVVKRWQKGSCKFFSDYWCTSD
jgi:hypothetical protein